MSSRLPETELANWSFLPVDQKHAALLAYDRPKKIPGSYEPFRRVFPDAINQQYPLFGDALKESEWASVERRLVEACHGNEKLISMNKGILKATHEYATAHSLSAVPIDVVPLRLWGGNTYSFGLSVLMRYRDHASFAFLDLRRSTGLNPNGRRFLFSIMHERFRAAYSDFSTVDLEIWRYTNNKKTNARTLVPQSVNESSYSFDDIVKDVTETYEIYEWIRRRGDGRGRAAGGSHGPLFD